MAVTPAPAAISLRVLRAARDAGVKRVVLTSAFGAIGMGHPPQTRPWSETDWTNLDGDVQPYQASKTLSERAAWDFVANEGGALELVAPLLDVMMDATSEKAQRVLGWKPRPVEECVVATAESLIRLGVVRPL